LGSHLCLATAGDLNQLSGRAIRRGSCPIVDVGIFVAIEQRGASCGQQSPERAEGVVDSARFVSAMHHAVGALRIAAFGSVLFPLSRADQFLERIGVAVLQQVTRLLPAEDVVRWHSPRRALVFPPSHQELEEEWTHVEFPLRPAIAQDLPEQTARFLAAEEVLLIGRLVVGVTRGKHQAFNTQIHHLVEELAHAFGVRPFEESRIRSHAEAALQGFAHSLYRFVVGSFAADGEIVVLAQAVHVNDEREILAGLELVHALFQQEPIGAKVNVFLASEQAFHNLGDSRVHERFAARDTHHRSAALVHRVEAFFWCELLLQDVAGVLNFPAACTGQVAAH